MHLDLKMGIIPILLLRRRRRRRKRRRRRRRRKQQQQQQEFRPYSKLLCQFWSEPCRQAVALRAVGALGGAEEPPQSPGNLSAAADGSKVASCLEVVQVRLHLLLPGGQLGQVLTQFATPAQDGPPTLLDHLWVRGAVRPEEALKGVSIGWV